MVWNKSTSGQSAQPIALSAGYWLLTGTITIAGSYATGGDTLDLSPFFPAGKTLREVFCPAPIRGFNGEYDVVNKKLKLWSINPAAASLDVGMLEHPAAAYIAALTATPVPMAFWVKG